MTTVTGTVAINPAFLEEIKNEHRELWALLDRIEIRCAANDLSVTALPELITLVQDLRDTLAMHFALEEAYGYFDDAIDVAPYIADTAESLRSQHHVLYREISELAQLSVLLQETQVTPDAVEELVESLSRFTDKLTLHEADERRLLMSAYLDDIGVGD